MLEERERAAVERRGRDDGVARLREVQERERLRGLAGGRRDGRDAPLELGEPPLEDVRRGVHEARVDVSELAQAEEARGVLGPVEDVRRRRVDRARPARSWRGRRPPARRGRRACRGDSGVSAGLGSCRWWAWALSPFGSSNTKKPALSRERAGWESDELFRLCSRFARFRSVLRDGPREASVRLPRRSAGHRAHAHADSNRDPSGSRRVGDGRAEAVQHVRRSLAACDSESQAKRKGVGRDEERPDAQERPRP